MNYRLDFELKLLHLFCDIGLDAKTEGQVRDLGAMLPALAASWQSGEPEPKRLLMSSSSLDFQTFQEHQRADAKLVKARSQLFGQ